MPNPMLARAIDEILKASTGALKKKPKAVSVEIETEEGEKPEGEGEGETMDAAGVEVPESEGDLTPDEMEMLRKHREMMGR